MPEGECAKASRFKAGRAYSSDIDLQKWREQYEKFLTRESRLAEVSRSAGIVFMLVLSGIPVYFWRRSRALQPTTEIEPFRPGTLRD